MSKFLTFFVCTHNLLLRAVTIEGEWETGKRPTIAWGILKGEYVFAQVKIQWTFSALLKLEKLNRY